jgi:DNA modification methylase
LNFEDGSIDLVLTSPPYLNAIDYMRCSKFSLVWMGHNVIDLRRIRGESVGAEISTEQALEEHWVQSLIMQLGLKSRLPDRDCAILSQYVWDMGAAIREVSRILKRGGRAVYVVGDSTMRGTFVRNSSIVQAIAEEHGLKLQSRHSRTLPPNRRYLPPPSALSSTATMDGRMREEVVLEMKKIVA